MKNSSNETGANPYEAWFKTLLPTQPLFAAITPPRPRFRRRRKFGLGSRPLSWREVVLQGATVEELATLNRESLIQALAKQKLVLTVHEMATMSGFDIETIRRRVKDGTLPRVQGSRIIRVHQHHFLRWLRGEKATST